VARLLGAGASFRAVRRAVQYLRRHTDRPLSKLALITDGQRILALTEDPQRMIEATAEGQVVIAIDVAPIRYRGRRRRRGEEDGEGSDRSPRTSSSTRTSIGGLERQSRARSIGPSTAIQQTHPSRMARSTAEGSIRRR